MADSKLTRGQQAAFWTLSGTILLQQVFDLVATLYLLQFPGAFEGNPIMAVIIGAKNGWLWFTLVKLLGTGAISFCIYKALRVASRWVWVFVGVIAAYFMLMGWQACLAWHLS